MKSNFLSAMLLLAAVLVSAGCYSTVGGSRRPGVPFSKDSIEGRYERPASDVYAAARKVLEFNGTLRGENTLVHTLEARVDTRTVWVRVTELEPNLSRVVVQARRKTGAGDVDLAAELEKQIALQLK